MGRRLDALLGRTKSSKLKPVLALALSRLAVLKKQREAKCSQSRSDVFQLLQLGHHERALLRVEQVIKEQNMLDVYVMIERYCSVLIERVHLVEQERDCPQELREAVSSMLYAASRCGDFPELQEIRSILSARFGKEFTARCIDLRNSCVVSLVLTQKLATKMPAREIRMQVLKEIASENSIVLSLEETSDSIETPPNTHASSSGAAAAASGEVLQSFKEETEKDDKYSKMVYKDVAHAAQAAFESAAYAAAAARAAVELSRAGAHDSDDHSSPSPKQGKLSISSRYVSSKTEFGSHNEHIIVQNQAEELTRSASSSSSDSEGDAPTVIPKDKVIYDDSDKEEITKALSPKRVPSRVQSGMKVEPERSSRRLTLNLEKGPFSLKNRRIFGN